MLAEFGGVTGLLTDLNPGGGPISGSQIDWLATASGSGDIAGVQQMNSEFDASAFLRTVRSAGVKATALADHSFALTLDTSADMTRLQQQGLGSFVESNYRFDPSTRTLWRYRNSVVTPEPLLRTASMAGVPAVVGLVHTVPKSAVVVGLDPTTGCFDLRSQADSIQDPTQAATIRKYIDQWLQAHPMHDPDGSITSWDASGNVITLRVHYADARTAALDLAPRKRAFADPLDLLSQAGTLLSLDLDSSDLVYRIRVDSDSATVIWGNTRGLWPIPLACGS